MIQSIVVSSADETEALGATVAARLAKIPVVLLVGPLGAGKTTFVRGLARGLGIDPAEVSSPTFALLHEYVGTAGKLLRHLDLYRVPEVESLREVGILEILDEEDPVVVEWPTEDLLGRPGALVVRIEPLSEDLRRVEILWPRSA